MKLVRIKDIPSPPDFPVARQTLYRWHHEGRYPELFVKFGGALCLDMDKQESALQRKKTSRIRKNAI